MLIVNNDNRNVVVGMDWLQAKLLVAAIRKLNRDQLIAASEDLQNDGFPMTAFDEQGAAQNFVTVLGMYTDKIAANAQGTEPPKKVEVETSTTEGTDATTGQPRQCDCVVCKQEAPKTWKM